MSWTAPRTWVTGEVVTAALLNTHIRDNLIDIDRRTSPIGATTATSESTSSVAYTDLATIGPAVSVSIGATNKALIAIYGSILVGTGLALGIMSFAISGGQTVAASDTYPISYQAPAINTSARMGATHLLTTLNGTAAGNPHTFTAKYRVSGGGSCTYQDRRILATPLGS